MQEDEKKIVPKFIAFRILEKLVSYHVRYGAIGDFTEYYYNITQRKGVFTARLWLLFQIVRIIPSYTMDSIQGSLAMFNNYLKITVRNMRKYKGYSFINIAGLSIGMACCILIFLYVREETSYDNYHKDKDRIFRIGTIFKTKTFEGTWAAVGPPVGMVLEKDFPQVEHVARIRRYRNPLIEKENIMYYENSAFFADNSLFNILTIPFLHGDPGAALVRHNTAVLSERIAQKYFDSENPLGKTLTIDSEEFEITGVIENPPSNTHIRHDILISILTLKKRRPFQNEWGWTNFNTYVKLKSTVNSSEFETLIRNLENNYVTGEQIEKRGWTNTYFLQPLTRIHLYSNYQMETEIPGNPVYVYITAITGFLILAIACINFMNLATAKFANRAKEVGLRKVIGAQRRQLIIQFLGESLLMSFIAFIFSFIIAGAVLPFFNTISGETFTVTDLRQPETLVVSSLLIIFIGLAAGSYPAFYLSMFTPGVILKTGRGTTAGSAALRKILVVGQFTISIILLIGTITVYKQISYMKNKNLGFEKEQKLFFQLGENVSSNNMYNAVKAEFIQIPGVHGTAVSSGVPGYGILGWQTRIEGTEDDKQQLVDYLFIDPDFIPLFKLKIAAGRAFKEDIRSDLDVTYIINETAVKAFGWQSPEEALNKRLTSGVFKGQVIGVVKDFHLSGVQAPVSPLALIFRPRVFRLMTLTVNTEEMENTIALIKEKFRELYPNRLFSYRFVDETFNNYYSSEERTGKLFSTFTCLGIFISCLGLFGLASYTAEQRTKEIGIRKVLGASIPEVVLLLQKEFIKWVAAAVIIAVPVAYFVMHKWLNNFAYRINPGFGVFILSSVLVLVVAVLTVSYRAVNASCANPVEALRSE